MNRILLLASFVFAVALAAAGCSSTCTHACEQQIKCEGAAPQACSYKCESLEHDADQASCSSAFQTWQTCIDTPADAAYCTDMPETRCSTQHDAYVVCLQAFCAAHPGDAVCAALAP